MWQLLLTAFLILLLPSFLLQSPDSAEKQLSQLQDYIFWAPSGLRWGLMKGIPKDFWKGFPILLEELSFSLFLLHNLPSWIAEWRKDVVQPSCDHEAVIRWRPWTRSWRPKRLCKPEVPTPGLLAVWEKGIIPLVSLSSSWAQFLANTNSGLQWT